MSLATLTIPDLARLADVAWPPLAGPGERFLFSVRDLLADWIDNADEPLSAAPLEELANDSVPRGTHEVWAVFYELDAWQVDVTDLTGDRISARALTEHAEAVLSFIAERLLRGLLERAEVAA